MSHLASNQTTRDRRRRRLQRRIRSGWLGLVGLLSLLAGCNHQAPVDALVFTQIPVGPKLAPASRDGLDQRYPTGSRVVLSLPPYEAGKVRVLSKGLAAAGNPVVCPCGKHVYFVARGRESDAWQIYEAKPSGGSPRVVTAMAGGAMDPAIVAHGTIVFTSPAANAGRDGKDHSLPALYTQSAGKPPWRLTFGTVPAIEPTVLQDGKILFVSAIVSSNPTTTPTQGLFTVNNDGSEFTAGFAENVQIL